MPRNIDLSQILGALGSLASVNARNAALRERKRANRLGTFGALGGAAAGFAAGGPQGAMIGMNIGKQAGSAMAGDPIDPVGATSSVLGVLNYQQGQEALEARNAQQAQQQADRENLANVVQGQDVVTPPGITDEALGPSVEQELQQGGGMFREHVPPTRSAVLGALAPVDPTGAAKMALERPPGFTLSPGQVRYENGVPVASGPPKPGEEKPMFGSSARGMAAQAVTSFNELRRQGVQLTPKQQEQDAIARQILQQETYVRDDRGNVYPMAGLTPPPIYGQQAPTAAPGPAPAASRQAPAPVLPATDKPVSQSTLESIQDQSQALSMLNIMEENAGDAGRFEGAIRSIGAALGTDDKAIAFNTARDKLRLSLQSTLKGIPSDRDQKLIDNLLPDLTDPALVKQTKIRIMRESIQAAQQGQLDYLRQNRMSIPAELEQARQRAEKQQSGGSSNLYRKYNLAPVN